MDEGITLIRTAQTAKHLYQSRLACAIHSEKRKERIPLDIQIQMIHSDILRKSLGQTLDFNTACHFFSRSFTAEASVSEPITDSSALRFPLTIASEIDEK